MQTCFLPRELWKSLPESTRADSGCRQDDAPRQGKGGRSRELCCSPKAAQTERTGEGNGPPGVICPPKGDLFKGFCPELELGTQVEA